MSLISYKRGQTGVVLRVKILDSSVSTGAGMTGMTNTSTGLRISTIADNEATATSYTAAGNAVETIATLGTFAAPSTGCCRFKEIDAANLPGVYEVQLADARFGVSSAKSLLVSISGVTNAAETDVVIPLVDLDPYNGQVDVGALDGDTTSLTQLIRFWGAMIVAGTVTDASPTTTSFTTSLTGGTSGATYVGQDIWFASGALQGQARRITNYDPSDTGRITVDSAFPSAPTSGDIWQIGGYGK